MALEFDHNLMAYFAQIAQYVMCPKDRLFTGAWRKNIAENANGPIEADAPLMQPPEPELDSKPGLELLAPDTQEVMLAAHLLSSLVLLCARVRTCVCARARACVCVPDPVRMDERISAPTMHNIKQA